MIIRHINHRGVQRRYLEYYKVFAEIYDTTPEDLRNQQELQQRILQCLNTLPERCRHAIHLRLIEELSNAEIAQRMNISKGTVELYMCKALAHLRKVFHYSNMDILY
jgi:RNA polymerase sigma-70 factor (ECF subfamily)